MASTAVAYNPSDPTQHGFLSALALGETGTLGPNSTFTGFGGTDLSGQPSDPFGFPQPLNTGSSSAAGTYQFVKSTWDEVANKYNLNFANPQDQNAGAWYTAQEAFSQATGGQSLENALQSGQYQDVQSALQSIWPSVGGSGAAPQGLANDLASGIGTALPSDVTGTGTTATTSTSGGGIFGAIENWFERFGLIVLGVIIVAVAGYFLLQKGSL